MNYVLIIAGFVSSLAFSAVMAFGRPKPPTEKLPISVSNCSSATSPVSQFPLTEAAPVTQLATPEDFNFFYSVSYAWYAAIGFVVTIGEYRSTWECMN